MNDGADISLVDAHAEGDGGYHHLDLAGLKCGLHALAGGCIEPGVIGRGVNRILRERLGERLRLFAGRGIDDGGTARGVGKQRADGRRAVRHRNFNHFDGQVLATETVNEAGGLNEAELLHDISLHLRRGGGGEGEDPRRHRRPHRWRRHLRLQNAGREDVHRACGNRDGNRGPIARCNGPRRWR